MSTVKLSKDEKNELRKAQSAVNDLIRRARAKGAYAGEELTDKPIQPKRFLRERNAGH